MRGLKRIHSRVFPENFVFLKAVIFQNMNYFRKLMSPKFGNASHFHFCLKISRCINFKRLLLIRNILKI